MTNDTEDPIEYYDEEYTPTRGDNLTTILFIGMCCWIVGYIFGSMS